MKRYIKSAIVNVSEMSWQEKDDFARDPEASPNILRQIFSSCDASETALLSYLATNPSTPIDVLSAMVDMDDQELHKDLLYNENLPKELLDKLAGEDNYSIQYNIARHPNTSAKTLRRLVSHNNRYDILNQVVINPNVTLSIVQAALKKSPEVVEYVLDNPKIQQEFKFGLCNNSNRYLRMALAGIATDPNMLMILSEDSDYMVRARVAGRYQTPVEALEKLAMDDEWLVAQEAKSTLAILSRNNRIRRALQQ